MQEQRSNSKAFGELIVKGRNGKAIRAKTHGQYELVKAIDANDLLYVNGPAGTGKAQPLYSKILTPTGWINMGDVSVGDFVISVEGTPTKVLGVYPQGIKDIYEVVFDDNTKTHCCGDHLWETQNRLERDGKRTGTIKNTFEIKNTLQGKDGRKNHSIPLVSPIQFYTKNMFIDPYIMGILLGDGCFHLNAVKLSSADAEIISYVSTWASNHSLLVEHRSNYDYDIVRSDKKKGMYCPNPLQVEIKKLGLFNHKSYDKFIPPDYLVNSIDHRIALLQGLMDSDGTISRNGMCADMSTTSKQLAYDVRALVNSLGGKVTIRHKKSTYTYNDIKYDGRISYRITLKLPAGIIPFRLQRKVNRFIPKSKYAPKRYICDVKLVGKSEAQCIMVEHPRHLYVTDDYILTHNTFLAIAKAVQGLRENKYKKIILTRPVVQAGEDLGFLPGELDEKMAPYMQPFYESLHKLENAYDSDNKQPRKKLPSKPNKKGKREDIAPEKEKDEDPWKGKIVISPLAYMRGLTFEDAFVIVDEAQNITKKQFELFLTRIGENSKVVITGDVAQVDIDSGDSGFAHAQRVTKHIDGIGTYSLTLNDVVRHRMVREIIGAYENDRNPIKKCPEGVYRHFGDDDTNPNSAR